MKMLSAFVAGLLFSVGLTLSGMTLPQNIIGFLDFFGEWKPALAFVMLGAVGVYVAAYPLVMKRRAPWFDVNFTLPTLKQINARLLVGSAAFGIGWGMGGFCPGPSIVALATGAQEVFVFVISMFAGILLHHLSGKTADSSCG